MSNCVSYINIIIFDRSDRITFKILSIIAFLTSMKWNCEMLLFDGIELQGKRKILRIYVWNNDNNAQSSSAIRYCTTWLH